MTSSEVESISAELPDPLLERPIPRPSRSSSDPSPLAKNHAYFGAGTKGSNPPCSSGESGELPYCACSPRVRRRCHLVIPHRAIVPLRSLHRRRLGPCCASAAAQPFHLLERARPVSAQQARQCTVGEEPPTGLAARAVVRLRETDCLLEEGGFEPSVPLLRKALLCAANQRVGTNGGATYRFRPRRQSLSGAAPIAFPSRRDREFESVLLQR